MNSTDEKKYYNVALQESMCSDGMCCFTCVIPTNNRHIGFARSFWRSGNAYKRVKLLVTSEGQKNELYDSCKFLDVIISEHPGSSCLSVDLRCSVYKKRPAQCKYYPDMAGEKMDQGICGPCIFNEYTASGRYKKLIYKREWDAFYAILDNNAVIQKFFTNKGDSAAREKLIKAKGVHLATISVKKKEQDFILIPVQKKTENILYLSEKHPPITTIANASHQWREKIKMNLQKYYGEGWESVLTNAIETEEKDARKGNNENATHNP